ncbi:MAG TPA: disulfide reductase [Anaerolineae bacterium]|nr:disulfide reductase [Anaerolineae bacterium]
MRYAYYPGCSLKTSAREYDLSVQAVCQELDIELVEVPDWNCCGASPAANMDPALSAALATRNLRQAEGAGLDTVIAPCSGCYKYLRRARQSLHDEPQVRERVQNLLGEQSLGPLPAVKHPLEVLTHDLRTIAAAVKRPLHGLRVACYYGCVISRPRGGFDDPEDPTSMDRLMAALNAEVVPYAYKTRCCGGAVMMPSPEVAFDLTGHLLRKAQEQGANCLALACPLCALLLDTYQSTIGRRLGTRFGLPIFYFTQLMGLALGIDGERLGLRYNVVAPFELLTEVGLEEAR